MDNLADQLAGKPKVVARQPVGRPAGTVKKQKRQTGYDPDAVKRRIALMRQTSKTSG